MYADFSDQSFDHSCQVIVKFVVKNKLGMKAYVAES